MAEIMNYDHNLVFCGRFVNQTVKLTFGLWEYRAEIETVIGGNCLGLEVIDTAVEDVYDKLPTERHGLKQLIMTDNNGGTLDCVDNEGNEYDWLKNMLVKAEITKIEEDKKC